MIRDKVTMTELEILLEINKNPRGVIELAKILQTSPKSVPVFVKRMVDKGVVQNAGANGRALYAITGEGLEIVRELRNKL